MCMYICYIEHNNEFLDLTVNRAFSHDSYRCLINRPTTTQITVCVLLSNYLVLLTAQSSSYFNN